MSDTDTTQAHIIRSLAQVIDRLDAIAPSTQTQLLSIQDAAARLGVSKDTVRRLCDRRELRYVQSCPNAAKRIPLSALTAWIGRHTVDPIC